MAKSKSIGTEPGSSRTEKKQAIARAAKPGQIQVTGAKGAKPVDHDQAGKLISMRAGTAPDAPLTRRITRQSPMVSAEDLSKAVREDTVEASVFLSRLVTDGIPVATASAFETVIDGMVAHAVLPRKTWQDAKASASKRLSTQNSERLIRTLKAIVAANDAFGEGRGEAWLLRPTEAFDGMTPMAMLATESGADAVEALLGRVKYGMTA